MATFADAPANHWLAERSESGEAYYFNYFSNQFSSDRPDGVEAAPPVRSEESNGKSALETLTFGEFNPDDGLLYDIQNYGFFDRFEYEQADDASENEEAGKGFIHHVNVFRAARPTELLSKIKFLRIKLEAGDGDDAVWSQVFQTNGFALMEFLLDLLLCKELSQKEYVQSLFYETVLVLAFAARVCPFLYADYVAMTEDFEKPLLAAVKVAQVADMNSREEKTRRLTQAMATSKGQYNGYDERDEADFGIKKLEVEEGGDGGDDQDEESRSFELSQVCVLMLEQLFIKELPGLKGCLYATSRFRIRFDCIPILDPSFAESMLEIHFHPESSTTQVSEEGIDGSHMVEVYLADILLALGKYVLTHNAQFNDDTYYGSVKFLAMMNAHSPRDTPHDSTRLASVCVDTAGQTENNVGAAFTQLSEGLLHLYNEGYYPYHKEPEVLPVLKLCRDLVVEACGKQRSSYFYTNDIKIMIEVILREITNLPCRPGEPDEPEEGGDEDDYEKYHSLVEEYHLGETVRVAYLELLRAFLAAQQQQMLEEGYSGEELGYGYLVDVRRNLETLVEAEHDDSSSVCLGILQEISTY